MMIKISYGVLRVEVVLPVGCEMFRVRSVAHLFEDKAKHSLCRRAQIDKGMIVVKSSKLCPRCFSRLSK